MSPLAVVLFHVGYNLLIFFMADSTLRGIASLLNFDLRHCKICIIIGSLLRLFHGWCLVLESAILF